MKRKILYSTFIFLALALSSCGSSGLKKPKKGKAINDVDIKYYNYDYDVKEIHVNKNDSFDDVLSKIELTQFKINEDTKLSYKYRNIGKRYVNNKNSYYAYTADRLIDIKETYTYTSNAIKYRESATNDKKTEITFNYYSSFKDSSKLNTKSDIQSKSSTTYENRINAGTYTESNDNYIYDLGEYYSYKNSYLDKKETYYKYVNKKVNEDNRYDRYYGEDKDGNAYTYALSDFIPNVENITNYFTYYNKDFNYFYDNKIELTDKYIILKYKSLYTHDMYNEAIKRLEFETSKYFFSNKEVSDKLVDMINEEYNGSYEKIELWINYNKKDENNNSNLCYDYFFHESYDKRYRKAFYGREDLEYLYNVTDNQTVNDLIGTSFIINQKYKNTYELVVNDDNYNKKIESFKKKADKNNIFNNIDMKVR